MNETILEVSNLTPALRRGRKVDLGGESEVLPGPERRRRWSVEEKLRILAEVEAGSPVAVVCRRHGLSTSLFYSWHSEHRAGVLPGFVPVRIAPVRTDTSVGTAPVYDPRLGIDLPSGARLTIVGALEAGQLRQVIDAVEGR